MPTLDLFRLDGKTALITGAGRGIGKSLAIGLADAGANIAAVDIDAATAKQTADELAAAGTRTLALSTDIRRPDAVQQMVEQTVEALGSLDILVNNAGIALHAHAEDIPLEDWDTVIDLNLRALFIVCQTVGKHMIARKSGSIINIASMSGSIVNKPQPQAAYNTSKAAVIMLTRSLAAEWAPHGVRVNSMSPGYTMTEMVMMPDAVQLHSTWKQMIPMNRLAKPEELRASAVYLASDASSYMTGHDLVIDGGYTAW